MRYRRAALADAAAIASVETITWDATYRGLIPDSVIEHRTLEHRTGVWTAVLSQSSGNQLTVFVVEDAPGKVVGFCDGGRPEYPYPGYDVEIIGLYVLPDFQHQGCGTELFQRVAADLRKSGGHSLIVWVLHNSKYRRFYERRGGRYLCDRTVDFGKPLVVSGYGWPDMNAIAAS